MCGKLTAYIIAFLFMGSAQIAGSPPSDIGKNADAKRYKEPLELAAKFMSGDCEEVPEGLYGIHEMRINPEDGEVMSWEQVREMVGYAFYDFDGDGVNELVIGSNIIPYIGSHHKTMILALYRMSDGKPKLLLSGTRQNSWFYQDNGYFYMTGEESAACVVSGVFSYRNNQLCCEHYWFSGLNSEGDLEYYHSYEETTDPEKGTKLSYTMDTYNMNDENNLGQTQCLDLTPFSSIMVYQ